MESLLLGPVECLSCSWQSIPQRDIKAARYELVRSNEAHASYVYHIHYISLFFSYLLHAIDSL